MPGYNPEFLAQAVPLPEFTPALAGNVLRRLELRDGLYADYVNYTVAMHQLFRAPLFAAFNIDQTLFKDTRRNDDWRIDSRIGAGNQLDNAYYRNNPWDRGHMARRKTAGWGETLRDAQRGSDETFYYSNASLQHENLNQDEWLALEDWVFDFNLDQDDKLSEFTGPVFGDFMRSIRPDGREAGFVPAAFFKVLFFMNKQGQLEVRAFIMEQDTKALKDKQGRNTFDHQIYQVSVTEIERRTGLIFPDALPARNPLFHNPGPGPERLNVPELPERREVNGPEDIIRDNDRPRSISFADDRLDVFIAAALVNSTGDERQGEWVSIVNLTNERVSIAGWKLIDDKRRQKTLAGSIGPGEAVRIQPLDPLILANDRAAFIQLIDDESRQIDRVPYSREQAQREGKPVVFAYRDLDYDLPPSDSRDRVRDADPD